MALESTEALTDSCQDNGGPAAGSGRFPPLCGCPGNILASCPLCFLLHLDFPFKICAAPPILQEGGITEHPKQSFAALPQGRHLSTEVCGRCEGSAFPRPNHSAPMLPEQPGEERKLFSELPSRYVEKTEEGEGGALGTACPVCWRREPLCLPPRPSCCPSRCQGVQTL